MKQLKGILKTKVNPFISPPKGSDFSGLEKYKIYEKFMENDDITLLNLDLF